MNESPMARRALLLFGAVVVTLLIVAGFNRGWLAWHSDQRPLGKLRPADLVGATSMPESSKPPETADSQPSTVPAPPTAAATSTTHDDHGSTTPVDPNSGPVDSSPSDARPIPDDDHDADD